MSVSGSGNPTFYVYPDWGNILKGGQAARIGHVKGTGRLFRELER
jgi:hypothetical protein